MIEELTGAWPLTMMEKLCQGKLNLILRVSGQILSATSHCKIGCVTRIQIRVLRTFIEQPFSALKSSFSEEPLDTWVVAGEDVKLPCEPPVGHPVPEIEWRKNGDKIVSSERQVVKTISKFLSFTL